MEWVASIFYWSFTHVWWTYEPGSDWYAQPYHWINLVEGAAWVVFGFLVLLRYAKHRRSMMEIIYGLSFFLFAATDFREAWIVESWLIWLKALNFAAILTLRYWIIKHYYPGSRTF